MPPKIGTSSGPPSLLSFTSSPVRVDELYEHFFNYDDYVSRQPYSQACGRMHRPAQPSLYAASLDRSWSWVSKDHVLRLCHKFKVPHNVHFYVPQDDERADQPPPRMIAINEYVLEVGLRFPLQSAISHLLAV